MSYNFPPVSKASSVVAGCLFNDWSFCDLSVVRGRANSGGNIIDTGYSVKCRQYICDIPLLLRVRSFHISLPVYIEHLLIPLVVVKVIRIIKKEAPTQLFVMFPTHFYAVAAYFIHLVTKLPLHIYFLDEWNRTRPHFLQRFVSSFLEPRVIGASKAAYFATDALRDLYVSRYGDSHQEKFFVLRLPTELPLHVDGVYRPIEMDDVIRVTYTGAIYEAQRQAISNLIKAISMIHRYSVELNLYTFQDEKELERMGLIAGFVSVAKASRSEIIKIQQSADILFVPMSFQEEDDFVS